MLLFIISEIMVFGAFFTAYFFIRVAQGDPWPAPGTHLPLAVAGFNTAILVSSSFTLHWAETVDQERQPLRAEGGHSHDLPAWRDVPVHPDQRVRQHRLCPSGPAQQTIFYALTGLHGAHVTIGLLLLLFVTIRSFRGHYSPEEHRGIEVPGIYWHFVDVMWIVVLPHRLRHLKSQCSTRCAPRTRRSASSSMRIAVFAAIGMAIVVLRALL